MAITASVPLAPPTGELAVKLSGVHKWYGEFHVLKNIDLNVQRGERIVICGPSGPANPP